MPASQPPQCSHGQMWRLQHTTDVSCVALLHSKTFDWNITRRSITLQESLCTIVLNIEQMAIAGVAARVCLDRGGEGREASQEGS